jgi:NADH-quinone oxidoreductase subunit L
MASMFHLFTHAMFQALLFLCAGAVIHAVHSNEIKDMGGLRKYMPVTHVTFLIACLAIVGIPPFSGFFSKDEILASCFQFSPLMGTIMCVIAGLTAFYMFRLYCSIFWSKPYTVTDHHHVPHEAPFSMTIPLIILAVITCVAGFVPFGQFISSNGEAYTIHLDWTIATVSVCVAVLGIMIAIMLYKGEKQHAAERLADSLEGLHRTAYHRFYIDEIYQFVTHKIIFNCISTPLAWFDRHVVDEFMNLLASTAQTTSRRIRGLQSGQVQQYAIVFLSGIVVLIVILLLI